jgi:hypothetical protein
MFPCDLHQSWPAHHQVRRNVEVQLRTPVSLTRPLTRETRPPGYHLYGMPMARRTAGA